MNVREELDALIARIGEDHALLKARLQHARRETFGEPSAADTTSGGGGHTPPPGG